MFDEHKTDLHPCVAHVYDVTDSDGRPACSECGARVPRYQDPDDCMDCGMCGDCFDRFIAAYEEGVAEAATLQEERE